jgi:anaerobic ribonucleoside-triphosphate reductase activating protein
MNYSSYINSDTVNGEGIRCSLWVSGCSLNCKGCFNTDSRDFNFGNAYTQEFENIILNDLKKPYISGLSILGGHMFEKGNYEACLSLIKRVKQDFDNKDIYVWSGYTLDIIKQKYNESLEYIDVLIDGPFIESLLDTTLYLRGSSNQKILKKGLHF